MKKLLIIFLFPLCLFSQQKITTTWHIVDDSTTYKMVEIADTTWHYKNDSLTFKRIENDTISYSYQGGKLVWWSEKKVEKVLIKDNRCNGIKIDGSRCSRSVDNQKGIYYCWQHK